jgi:hypothetical protein
MSGILIPVSASLKIITIFSSEYLPCFNTRLLFECDLLSHSNWKWHYFQAQELTRHGHRAKLKSTSKIRCSSFKYNYNLS